MRTFLFEEEKKEISEEEIEKLIEKMKKELSPEEFEEFMDDLENLDDEDFEDMDEFNGKDKKDKKANESFEDNEDYLYEGVGKFIKGNIKRNVRRAFAAGWQGAIHSNPGAGIAALVQRSRTRKNMAYLQKQADITKDPKEKEKFLRQKEAIGLSSFDSNGVFIIDPIARKGRQGSLIKDGKIKESDIPDRESMKKLRKDAREFCKSDEGKKYKKEAKKELRKARVGQALGITDMKDAANDLFGKKKKKEETVKDKDGSEIIARAKKNGHGTTFVRKKNGKEIGYATKDEFQAAKKKANESIDRDLRNYIYECLEK